MSRFSLIKSAISVLAATTCIMVFQNCGQGFDASSDLSEVSQPVDELSTEESSFTTSASSSSTIKFSITSFADSSVRNRIVSSEAYRYAGNVVWLYIDGQYAGGFRTTHYLRGGYWSVAANSTFSAQISKSNLKKYTKFNANEPAQIQFKVGVYESIEDYHDRQVLFVTPKSDVFYYNPSNPSVSTPPTTTTQTNNSSGSGPLTKWSTTQYSAIKNGQILKKMNSEESCKVSGSQASGVKINSKNHGVLAKYFKGTSCPN